MSLSARNKWRWRKVLQYFIQGLLVTGLELAGIGYSTLRVFGAPDGGLVSARVQGSVLYPCSEPVLRQ